MGLMQVSLLTGKLDQVFLKHKTLVYSLKHLSVAIHLVKILGKTFTMGTESMTVALPLCSDDYGIIPRAIKDLYEMIDQREKNDPNSTYRVHVQFLEIYGEEIRDLLDNTKTSKVTIRETSGGDVFVAGLKEEVVGSTAEIMKALEIGSRNRTIASTAMNNTSSRSHGEI